MLLSALILIAVDGKHDGLEEGVNFGHGDQSAEMGDVSGFRLQQEQQVAVFLRLFIVGERTLLHIGRVIEMVLDFLTLKGVVTVSSGRRERGCGEGWWWLLLCECAYLFKCHAILDEQGDAGVEVSHILFQDEILLGLG